MNKFCYNQEKTRKPRKKESNLPKGSQEVIGSARLLVS